MHKFFNMKETILNTVTVRKNKRTQSFVRMFMPAFAQMVECNEKLQTVRPRPKRMPRPGDKISLRAWKGKPYRSKQLVLKETTIQDVEDIEIFDDSIHISNRRLSSEEREAFAKADGFANFEKLSRWFQVMHGLPFEGIVISWPKSPRYFRAGDTVHHKPSSENWILATDEENGRVQACGWPESMASAKDCRLIEAATDDQRLSMLNEWAKTGKGCEHERDSRTRAARRQISSEND